MCTGLGFHSDGSANSDIADIFVFNVVTDRGELTTQGIAVAFVQKGDKIIFKYKKDIFDVVSITDDLITLEKEGIKHSIQRIELPL